MFLCQEVLFAAADGVKDLANVAPASFNAGLHSLLKILVSLMLLMKFYLLKI